MAWARIDDKFLDNPKVRKAGKEATYLYVSGLVYSSSQLTERFVSDDALGLVAYKGFIKNEQTHTATLVECGLWDRVEGGYHIHDYLEYNPIKQQIEQAREKKTAAGSKGAQARWQNDSKADGKTMADAIPSAITPAIANAWQGDSKPIALTHPIPSHPIPYQKKIKKQQQQPLFMKQISAFCHQSSQPKSTRPFQTPRLTGCLTRCARRSPTTFGSGPTWRRCFPRGRATGARGNR